MEFKRKTAVITGGAVPAGIGSLTANQKRGD
jgi:hypothetical protein